jgi:hypothetical protein
MLWVKEEEQNNIKENIVKLTKNIENNNLMIGEFLNNLSLINEIDFKEFGLSDTKGRQLIKNYIFAKKYDIKEDIGFSKLSLLTKIKESDKRINDIIKFSLSSNLEELKQFIYKNDVQNFTSKNIVFDEEDLLNLELSKKICINIAGTNLNNSQIFKYILMDFIHNNSEYLNEIN